MTPYQLLPQQCQFRSNCLHFSKLWLPTLLLPWKSTPTELWCICGSCHVRGTWKTAFLLLPRHLVWQHLRKILDFVLISQSDTYLQLLVPGLLPLDFDTSILMDVVLIRINHTRGTSCYLFARIEIQKVAVGILTPVHVWSLLLSGYRSHLRVAQQSTLRLQCG
jgi:hypothetical protein